MTVYFNSGATGTYFGNPTGSSLSFNTGRAPLNWPLVYRELDTSTAAVVNAASIRPSTQRQVDMDNLVRDLKAASIWNSLDLFYVLANETSQLALLNWKAPSTFAGTATNAPTFTQDRGYTGNGSNAFIATGWNFSINGVKYTQNSAMLGGWNLTAPPNNVALLGSSVNAANVVVPRGGSGTQFRLRVNNTAPIETGNVSDASGLSVAVRTDASTIASYKNGTLFGTPQAAASEALTNDTLTILRGLNTYFNGQAASAFVGANITAAQQLSLFTALQT